MAKAYKFVIVLRKAEFKDGIRTVHFGLRNPDSTYHHESFTGTLVQVISRRVELSSNEKRPHAAVIVLDNRTIRKPVGFDAKAYTIYGGAEE